MKARWARPVAMGRWAGGARDVRENAISFLGWIVQLGGGLRIGLRLPTVGIALLLRLPPITIIMSCYRPRRPFGLMRPRIGVRRPSGGGASVVIGRESIILSAPRNCLAQRSD